MENDMACPRCREPLETRRGQGRLHYVCPSCGGQALTLGALRARCGVHPTLPEDRALRELWQIAQNVPASSATMCPFCGIPMRQVMLPTPSGAVEVDVCIRPACQLIWFDPGELEALPEKAAPTEDLPPKAREALALHRAAEQARMHEIERVKEDMETGRWYDASTGEGTFSQLFRLLDRAAAALRNDE